MAAAEHGFVPLSDLGGSLPVENVQSIAANKNLIEIPERYIRPEVEIDPVLNGGSDGEIPVIDLSKLIDIQHSQEEVMRLGLACEEWGFFQLINHGIPDEVIESMKSEMQAFFQLPLEEKKAYAQLLGTLEGYGQALVVSEDQKLDWGDMYLLGTQPVFMRKMELWATNLPAFSAALDQYSWELKRVSDILYEYIGKSLRSKEFANLFEECVQVVRMNYYPPCPHAPTKVVGISPHSDTVALTLLLQVNQVQGLQIRRNGGWMPIEPLPSALVVNIGDIIEILSNGKYKSVEHRAVINPEKERMSIAAFHLPNYHVQIGPLPELVQGSEEFYKTISVLDYTKSALARKLEGKKNLEYVKLRE